MNFRISLLVALLVAIVGSTASAAILDSNGSPVAHDPNLRLWLDASNASSLYQPPFPK